MKRKYSLLFSNRRDTPEPESSVEGIYPSLKEFKNSQVDTDPVLKNMDANVLQKLIDDRDRRITRTIITSYQGAES